MGARRARPRQAAPTTALVPRKNGRPLLRPPASGPGGRAGRQWRWGRAAACHDARSEERRVGKEVSVRVDLGGRRLIKKKHTLTTLFMIHYNTTESSFKLQLMTYTNTLIQYSLIP